MRALERELGVTLFVRRPRAPSLTPAGRRYRDALGEAFDRVHAATRELRAERSRQVLTISVLPSFAARWLVARLGGFSALHPGIDVRIAPSVELADFSRDDIDVGIRYGGGRYRGLRSHRLLDDELFPVCSPDLLRGPRALRTPSDLAGHTLLHDENRDDWLRWLEAAGARGGEAQSGPLFTDASLLIQAAVQGQGVGLARGVLVAEELAAGRLVEPFTTRLRSELAYYLVYPEAGAASPPLAAFRAWLLAEVAPAAREPGEGDRGSAPAGVERGLAPGWPRGGAPSG